MKTQAEPGLVVCEDCDAVHAWAPLAAGDCARCRRCGALLARGHRLGTEGQLALVVAALVVFAIANLSDIVRLEMRGLRVPLTLGGAVVLTWLSGEPVVALLAAATAFVFPLAVMLLRLWLLLPLALGRRPWAASPVLRLLHTATRWSMVEVFLLGTLIAVGRSAGLAAVVIGPGLYAWAALMLLLAAVQVSGLHALWERAVPLRDRARTGLGAGVAA